MMTMQQNQTGEVSSLRVTHTGGSNRQESGLTATHTDGSNRQESSLQATHTGGSNRQESSLQATHTGGSNRQRSLQATHTGGSNRQSSLRATHRGVKTSTRGGILCLLVMVCLTLLQTVEAAQAVTRAETFEGPQTIIKGRWLLQKYNIFGVEGKGITDLLEPKDKALEHLEKIPTLTKHDGKSLILLTGAFHYLFAGMSSGAGLNSKLPHRVVTAGQTGNPAKEALIRDLEINTTLGELIEWTKSMDKSKFNKYPKDLTDEKDDGSIHIDEKIRRVIRFLNSCSSNLDTQIVIVREVLDNGKAGAFVKPAWAAGLCEYTGKEIVLDIGSDKIVPTQANGLQFNNLYAKYNKQDASKVLLCKGDYEENQTLITFEEYLGMVEAAVGSFDKVAARYTGLFRPPVEEITGKINQQRKQMFNEELGRREVDLGSLPIEFEAFYGSKHALQIASPQCTRIEQDIRTVLIIESGGGSFQGAKYINKYSGIENFDTRYSVRYSWGDYIKSQVGNTEYIGRIFGVSFQGPSAHSENKFMNPEPLHVKYSVRWLLKNSTRGRGAERSIHLWTRRKSKNRNISLNHQMLGHSNILTGAERREAIKRIGVLFPRLYEKRETKTFGKTEALGMRVHPSGRIETITRGGQAATLGVHVGWTIFMVNGQLVNKFGNKLKNALIELEAVNNVKDGNKFTVTFRHSEGRRRLASHRRLENRPTGIHRLRREIRRAQGLAF